jgi:hypothetical protein
VTQWGPRVLVAPDAELSAILRLARISERALTGQTTREGALVRRLLIARWKRSGVPFQLYRPHDEDQYVKQRERGGKTA